MRRNSYVFLLFALFISYFDKIRDTSLKRLRVNPFAALIVLLSGVGTVLSIDQIMKSDYFTIKYVELSSNLEESKSASVQRSIWRNVSGNFLTVDLDRIELRLEAMPGVYSSNIRRIWPDTLVATIVETNTIAEYKATDKYYSDNKSIFVNLPPSQYLSTVPILESTKRDQEIMLQIFVKSLPILQEAGLEPLKLSINSSGKWSLNLRDKNYQASDFEVVIGQDNILKKISRLASSYDLKLRSKAAMIQRVDMRYESGFAIRWRDNAIKKSIHVAGLTRNSDDIYYE